MSVATVAVAAPSRLHFGLFSFGPHAPRQFGGAGVMIDRPGLDLRITPAYRFSVNGPLAQRAWQLVERLAGKWRLASLPACHLEILRAPPEHVGLGTGTQLALAVTSALAAWRGEGPRPPEALAELAGRGARSAVGTYGFAAGGFVVEAGKLPGETLAPLVYQAPLPSDWRFVLAMPPSERGLSGADEANAFRDLPAVAAETSAALRSEVDTQLIPAAAQGDFERFSRSLYAFGYRAGLCFARQQGGAFAGARVARLVQAMRDLGVSGVGQSSWGPTVFALLPAEDAARRFVERLSGVLDGEVVVVAEPNRGGARLTRSGRP